MTEGKVSSIQRIKRRIYLIGFPLGVIAALGVAYAGWHQETPGSVQAAMVRDPVEPALCTVFVAPSFFTHKKISTS